MPTDTETRLRQLGTALLHDQPPIRATEVADHRCVGTVVALPAANSATDQRWSRRGFRQRTRVLMSVAAAAALLGGMVTLVARNPGAPVTDRVPKSTVMPMGPTGALTLDPVPEGWTLTLATNRRRLNESGGFVDAIYASDSPRPELEPAIIATMVHQETGSPAIPETGTRSTTVQGRPATLMARLPGAREVAFQRDGYWFTLTSYRMSETELLAAAERTTRSVDGKGARIDPAGLPAGLALRSVGFDGGVGHVPFNAADLPAPSAAWHPVGAARDDTSGPWFAYHASMADPALLPLGRIGGTSIDEVSVGGAAGYLVDNVGSPGVLKLRWVRDGVTYSAFAAGLDPTRMIELAESLRPATGAEWASMLAVVEPPVASPSPETGLLQPGSRIPTGVQLFPVVDEQVVNGGPAEGIRATYGYFAGADDLVAAKWQGVIGRPGIEAYQTAIVVTVSERGAAEDLPVVPGRRGGVGEYRFGSGTELRYEVDGFAIVLNGTDVDLLYELIDRLRPTVADGELTGFEVTEELPSGWDVLVAPIDRSWRAGAFPQLWVRSGAFRASISPTPMILQLAAWREAFEPVRVAGRAAMLLDRPNAQGPEPSSMLLLTELDDGTTLNVEGYGLSRADFLAAVAKIEFVDEQTWIERYNPMLPIVPSQADSSRLEETQATTA